MSATSSPRGRRGGPPPDLTSLHSLPDDALVGVDLVAALLGVSERHIWRLNDRNAIVAPLRLGAVRRWRLGDLRQWLRDGAPAGVAG
jgi:predicted DNA-binding transcriptional regulator AlpA